MQTYFLPMTRMNFVAAIDAGLLAPAGFFMQRKFYEENDVSMHYPNCHLLSTRPCHLTSSWKDKENEDVLNFPLIVEVAIPLNCTVQVLSHTDGKLKDKMIDATGLTPASIFLYAAVIPLSSIVAVTVPGVRALHSLDNDPYLKHDHKFQSKVLEKIDASPVLEAVAKGGSLPSATKSLSLEELNFYLRVIAGITLAAESISTQQWTKSWSSAEAICAMQAFVNGLDSCERESEDVTRHMAFQPIHPVDDLNSLSWLVKLSLRSLRGASSAPSFISSDGVEHHANHLVLYEMFIAFSQTNPSKSSPSEVVTSLIESVKNIVPQQPDDEAVALQRLMHGLQLVLESNKGVSETDVFKSKVDWATSVRASMLFCLRSEPDQLLNWEVEGRPRGAKLGDLSKAAFFSGLYHGFTVLPVSIKRKWQPFLDECFRRLFGHGAQKTSICSTWRKRPTFLDGRIAVSFGESGEVSLSSGVHISEILQDYIDFVSSDIKTGSISILDKYILSIIANQKNLLNFKTLNIRTDNPAVPSVLHDNSLSLRQSETEISLAWDYPGIIEFLSDSTQVDFSEEVLALICKRLEYNFVSFLTERGTTLNQSIESWLRGYEKVIPLSSSIDKAENATGTGKIHCLGRQLVKSMADFFSTDSYDISKDIQLLHGLLYVAFPVDLISEGIDPDLGLIDDWIILSDITDKFCELLAKKKNKNILSFTKVARSLSEQLLEEISKEFGEGFILSVLKSSPTNFTANTKKDQKISSNKKPVKHKSANV